MAITTRPAPKGARLFLAALAAACAAMPVYAVFLLQTTGGELGGFLPEILVLAFFITFVALLIVGIPVYFSLERRDDDSFATCGFLGALCGFIASGILLMFVPGVLLVGALAGAVAGLTFRLVARGL